MNIYVSNLNYRVTDSELNDLFAAYGEIQSAKVITDRETGQSRGFGFVEMTSDEDGQKAIDALNQSDFEGKTINVNIAKPKTDAPRSGGFNRGGGFGGGRRY
ncbi:MAG: RNA-binding protein [Mucinivorans sp.]